MDTYPVGLLLHLRQLVGCHRIPDGYLCEHTGHHHNAGRGWTKRTAQRRAQTICHAAANRP